MSELKCYSGYNRSCEYHQMKSIPSGTGRTQKNGSTLFIRLTHDDQCVSTRNDILRLKNMGFNRFILSTILYKEKQNQVQKYGLDNSEIMLELDADTIRGDNLKSDLEKWLRDGFAGGRGGDFYAILFDEPHTLYSDDNLAQCQKDYLKAVHVIWDLKQQVALGEMMVTAVDFFGVDITNDHFADFDETKANMLFYTAYDGPWTYWNDGSGDSDQRYYWQKMYERADRRTAYPFITLSRWYNGTMYVHSDVDYLDTLLSTSKLLFNGAAAYPQEIIDEFVHKMGKICALHDDYGAKDIWEIPGDLEPELKRLLETSSGFGAMRRCICNRRGRFEWPSGYLTTPDRELNRCSDKDLVLLTAAYCELYWRRLEMFCAAAERQGLLTQQTVEVTKQIYYCAKSDCNACQGTDPFNSPELWRTTPLPLCPKVEDVMRYVQKLWMKDQGQHKKMAYPDFENSQQPPFHGGQFQETPNEAGTMYAHHCLSSNPSECSGESSRRRRENFRRFIESAAFDARRPRAPRRAENAATRDRTGSGPLHRSS